MSQTRRLGVALGTLVSLGGLLTLGAPAASAATPAETCPWPHPTVAPVCVYDGADFTGLLENRPVWSPGLSGKDDRISSIINDSDYRIRVFSDRNYGGDWLEIGPHQKWVAPAEWDNRISSYFLY
ncbi:peptidase inhibitor family I36 protein [Streptomyces sp. TRM 70361]|uniref:peptidase inhibitor family I36 protein n=1 Tax=Streptomyces sp. TRM 70361 TaxID=3116553 RepID=UPI002E7C0121|nr:peptidase inhibitor family I36 protein [Streptomyces sp. TRM 70361]MEE1940434.1 peptidase inhibitor family I36 protein [Streptomyces sp. TRM 70361]